jgi:hypothetical protein
MAPGFAFATLYRVREWRDGALHDRLSPGMMLGQHERLGALFEVPFKS